MCRMHGETEGAACMGPDTVADLRLEDIANLGLPTGECEA